MSNTVPSTKSALPKGVMLNAYPDSIGHALVDTVDMLKRPEFKDVFSLFYVLVWCEKAAEARSVLVESPK